MSFEEFARARLPAMLRLAYAICLDQALAEDLVQEVLMKVQQRWSRISGLAHQDAYIRRMLVNEHVSWRRKWGRLLPHADVIATSDRRLTGQLPDHAATYADRAALQASIAKLPRQQQVVLGLRYYAGLTDTEIAHALGCTSGTVRGYASRALAALRIDTLTDTATAEIDTEPIPSKGTWS